MRNRFLKVGVLVLFVAACDGTRAPTAPTASPSSATPSNPTPSLLTLTGVVYEHTAQGRRPLAAAGIDVSAEYQSFQPKAFSDSEGRYSLGVPGLQQDWKIVAEKAGYRQPCRTRLSATTIDLHLVSEAVLSAIGFPASFPVGESTLTGRVFEAMPGGPQPVAGASITADLSGGMGWGPAASTTSNRDGGYALCGLDQPLSFGLALYTSKPGYQAVFTYLHDQTTDVGIELSRR